MDHYETPIWLGLNRKPRYDEGVAWKAPGSAETAPAAREPARSWHLNAAESPLRARPRSPDGRAVPPAAAAKGGSGAVYTDPLRPTLADASALPRPDLAEAFAIRDRTGPCEF